ncbi:hypothetical protein M422DRAFT_209897 [Sphaerobolus stellatus SS14]|uniref:Xylose isomerase-like TIM barrel domain-containing protein n=1 Tax=Sphaerobolus stellatus (strain SS14) TaxID=990650 RepID=A0A0C9VPZ5_SPHS4|nr:hypothetical protein M422DRAFT_209897 [Sphaerobolus stellatus SS14]
MSLESIKKCYATPSAGMHPSHTLPMKLRAIAEAGFPLAEISFPELQEYAKQKAENVGGTFAAINDNGEGDVDKAVDAAKEIKGLTDELGIKIIVMHPFTGIEGEKDPEKRAAAFARAKTWFKVLKALGCQTMQLGSNKNEGISDSFETMANDLRELADLAAQENPPIRIAYEMWAWGTYVNTWRHTWEICRLVDRDNFFLCLDTFQICAQGYADPTRPDGISTEAKDFNASLEALSSTIPPSKILYLQISDASHVNPSELVKEAKDQGMRPLYMWSNKYRPLPYAKKWNVYLPVNDVVEAVLKTGWRGPWSYEVFFEQDMAKDDPGVPQRWTREAAECHEKILEEMRRRGLK